MGKIGTFSPLPPIHTDHLHHPGHLPHLLSHVLSQVLPHFLSHVLPHLLPHLNQALQLTPLNMYWKRSIALQLCRET